MEWTFSYKVMAIKTGVEVSEYIFSRKVTKKEAYLIAYSYMQGKYSYMEEDKSLKDLCDKLYKFALKIEKQEEYGNLIGTELEIKCFMYPKEAEMLMMKED